MYISIRRLFEEKLHNAGIVLPMPTAPAEIALVIESELPRPLEG